ncbi:hypothetical protein SDC9_55223 [bioreactor metagenome]|uniref:Uncharacterized protein n=1 Tax=bioreactor metagenome TaxID=1076179 RepID=A0A644WYW9_9ZZZZ
MILHNRAREQFGKQRQIKRYPERIFLQQVWFAVEIDEIGNPLKRKERDAERKDRLLDIKTRTEQPV